MNRNARICGVPAHSFLLFVFRELFSHQEGLDHMFSHDTLVRDNPCGVDLDRHRMLLQLLFLHDVELKLTQLFLLCHSLPPSWVQSLPHRCHGLHNPFAE